jgi:hypothetical protein
MVYPPITTSPSDHLTNSTNTTYSIGSLVTARGREWVVLPDSTDELIIVKPLGGSDDEITGILTTLEPVKPASFIARIHLIGRFPVL